MDHHCIWLDTCIGFKNQPHFTRFLIFTSALAVQTTVLMMARVGADLKAGEMRLSPAGMVVVSVHLAILWPTSAVFCMMTWNQVC